MSGMMSFEFLMANPRDEHDRNGPVFMSSRSMIIQFTQANVVGTTTVNSRDDNRAENRKTNDFSQSAPEPDGPPEHRNTAPKDYDNPYQNWGDGTVGAGE